MIYKNFESWKLYSTPVHTQDVIAIFSEYVRKTKHVHSMISFGADNNTNNLIQLVLFVSDINRTTETLSHILSCFEPMVLHHLKIEKVMVPSVSLFLETKGKTYNYL